MARALEPDTRFQVRLDHDDGIGMGRVSLPFQDTRANPVWNDDRSVCIAVEGEVYNANALRQSMGDIPGDPGTPRLLLQLYDRCGDSFARELNGAFIVAIWDRRTRQLKLINDRLGLFPLYYANVGDNFMFASGVRALLADSRLPRTVDRAAMSQFLLYDHMLDDRTLLESVRLLPQGSVLTFGSDAALNIQSYWSVDYPEFYEPRAEADYVEEFVELLRQSVRRQRPDRMPAGLLLSGGLDSRLLLALLSEESGQPLETLTFGIPGCDDARVARELASKVGTDHEFFELRPDWLEAQAEEAVRATDGLANIVNLHVMANLNQQTARVQILYKGFMGDAMFGFALKRQMWGEYAERDRFEVHRGAHREQGVLNYQQTEEELLFTDDFMARAGDAAHTGYEAGMDRSGARLLASQRLYFDLTQRVPRMTLRGVEAARRNAIVRLPFCDNDLLDFALNVPPGFLFGRHLVEAALVRHFPKLAQIPVAGTGRPLKACSRDLIVQFRQLASWHLRHAGLGWLAGPERRPYKDYATWFRTTLSGWMKRILLDPRALDRGYFRPDFVHRLVAEHESGSNHAVRLGALLTVELWHRQFVD